MPRAKQKTDRPKAVSVVTEIEGDAEVKGAFPLVVRSFTGLLPGEVGYDADKDQLLIGFKYGNSTAPSWLPSGTKKEDVTPYDFLTDPKTGRRAGQSLEPHGAGYTSLAHGVGMWADLPPLAIWKQGRWLSDILWDVKFDGTELTVWLQRKIEEALLDWPKSGVPMSLFPYYVTSGEGTTGNSLYRVFELPPKECGTTTPHHPMMWPESERKPWLLGGLGSSSTPTPSTTPVKKPPPLPAGLRYRCPDCGHWYDQSDLPGHAQVCGKGEEADWAIMCHRDCGCQDLHEACKPKPGFPRPKKVEEPATEGENQLALAVVEVNDGA